MKRKRYTEEQIICVLKEHEDGVSAQDLIRKHGIANGTFYQRRFFEFQAISRPADD